MVVRPITLRPGVSGGQVEQFPTNLKGGEVVEVLHRLWWGRLQRPAQPDEGVLKHVVGLLFDPNSRKSRQHPPRELFQPLLGTADQGIQCSIVTGLEATTIGQLAYPLGDRKRRPMPAGGLFSTAVDVSRFCQMIHGRGVFHGKRYLSEAAVAQMTSKQTGDSITEGYGLGWFTWPVCP